MAPERAPYLASAAVLYTFRGREPSTRPGGVSRSRTEPLAPRAVRPGGAINPHARKGVSTFGNTGKHRTAQVPVPTAQVPVPTAQVPLPTAPKGA